MIAGVVGYFLEKLGFSTAPLILAVVIGPMLEDALRQSLLLSHGSLTIFINQPIACSLLVMTSIVTMYIVKIDSNVSS